MDRDAMNLKAPEPIKNGSMIIIGDYYDSNCVRTIVDKHFNRFQKWMIKWCFGFEVMDYEEED